MMTNAERSRPEPKHRGAVAPSPSDRLNAVGLKATGPRLKVLNFLATFERRHITADEVHMSMCAKGVRLPIGTVYRILGQLTDVGILARHIFSSGTAHYELSTHRHHDHVICLQCGKIEDFDDQVIANRKRTIADSLGYAIAQHELTLYGYCPSCRAERADV